nr:DUF6194 family protein [uncultured Pedobacter sp.]
MTIKEIIAYILSNFKNVNITEANGDLFFMYDQEKMMPFATIVTSDNDFDSVSQLNREGFFRLNIGIDKTLFVSTFDGIALKKGIGAYVDSGIDFTAENIVMPHPFYGAMYWLCIVNPAKDSLPGLKSYLDVAYALAVKRYKG